MKSFRNNCSSCDRVIPSHELVIKTVGNVYHVNCFTCVVCHCRLERGQDFALKENKLYCKKHFQQMEETIADPKQHNENLNSDHESDNDTDSEGKKPTKRPRTVLTSQQQSIFQSSFEISPKPCRKVREELSRETGLSVRVVQVWFQNQRAKVKKLARRDRYRSYNFSCYKGRYRYGKRSSDDKDSLSGYNLPLPMGQPETLPLPPMSHFTNCSPMISPHQIPQNAPWHLGDTMDFLFSPLMKDNSKQMASALTPVAQENSHKEYQQFRKTYHHFT